MRSSISLLLLVLLAAPAAARSNEPGSVLVFPVHRSEGALTVLSVTNASGTDDVRATFHFVGVDEDPADPLHPLDCGAFYTSEVLTPNDTVSRVAGCVGGGTDAGFVVVIAKDPVLGCSVAHDALVGSELVVGALGGVYSLLPFAFRAEVPAGACTDLDGDGRLDFDGLEYEGAPDVLLLDSFAPAARSSLVLLPLVPDLEHAEVTVKMDVFNDAELPLSHTFSFRCWTQVPLAELSGVFTEAYLAGTPNDPDELDLDCVPGDDLETGWARIDALWATTSTGTILDPPLLGAVVGGPGSLEAGRALWGSGTSLGGEL